MAIDTTRIDTSIYVRPQGTVSAFLDWLQMLTGVGLILFMWSHMVMVASVNLGVGAMNALAEFLERYYIAQSGGPLIALTFLVHFVLAARKIPFRTEQQAAMWKHSKMLRHRDTWLWVIQVVTAMFILIMGCIHMWTVLTDLPITAQKSAARIQGGFWLVFYLILLPMIELHVGIGFYRIGVKWGVIKRRTRSGFKNFENILTLGFILIGLVTIFNFYFIVDIMTP